jgi:HlyD family secretion protein
MRFDANGTMVHEEEPRNRRRGANVEPTVSASTEPPPGHTRDETEGVFLVRDGRAVFTKIKVGVAGERYFEVLDGVKTGDQVVTGPFTQVRELADGAEVKIEQESAAERRRRQQAENDSE